MRILLLALLACSPPSRPPTPRRTPADARTPDAAPVVTIDAPPQPYTFPWQQLRDWFDNVIRGNTPCDYRHDLRAGKVGTGDCTPPAQMAAKVQLMKLVAGPELRADVSVDLGSDEGVAVEWYAALIDDQGRLITTWEHPHAVQLHQSFLTFQVRNEAVRQLRHVAFVKERP